jgi:hypothetical protein
MDSPELPQPLCRQRARIPWSLMLRNHSRPQNETAGCAKRTTYIYSAASFSAAATPLASALDTASKADRHAYACPNLPINKLLLLQDILGKQTQPPLRLQGAAFKLALIRPYDPLLPRLGNMHL